MVKLIIDSNEKEEIASTILNNLPEWFGLPDSTEKYINDSKSMTFWAFIKEKPMGFIVLNETSDSTAEIYVMGVLNEAHNKGIGTELWNSFLKYAKKEGYEYIQVKTVQRGYYKEYDIINDFYKHLGFKELEVFPNMWDKWNPCQIYIKYIGNLE